jgi:hypothetical protein
MCINGCREGHWCTISGMNLNWPMPVGNKDADLVLTNPARLELTCNHVSTADVEERMIVS